MTLLGNFREKFKVSHFPAGVGPGLSFDRDFFAGLVNSLDTLAEGCVGEGVVKNCKDPTPDAAPPQGESGDKGEF